MEFSLETYYLGDSMELTGDSMELTEPHDLSTFKMCLAADGGSALPSLELETTVKVTLLF